MARKKPPTDDTKEYAALPPMIDPDEYRVAKATSIWSYDDTGFDLNVEEQLFVRSYIIDRNPVAALRRLNYAQDITRLKVIAKQLLNNPEVQGAIEHLAKRMMQNLEISAERVQRRIASVAFFDPRAVMEFDNLGLNLLNSRYWTEEQAANIQSVKMGKDGIEVKFYDGLRAAEMLAKQLQMQPEDDKATTAEHAKAAAQEVIDKIVDVFIKTRKLDPDELDRRKLLRDQRDQDTTH